MPSVVLRKYNFNPSKAIKPPIRKGLLSMKIYEKKKKIIKKRKQIKTKDND